MGPIGCPENSIRNYHHSLRSNPEERSYHIQDDSNRWSQLKSKGRLNTVRRLVAVFQFLCLLYGLTCVGYAQNSLEFVSRSPLIHVVGRSFCLTQTAYLHELVIPATNALPRWRLNVETKTKRTLRSFNKLTNAKKSCAA